MQETQDALALHRQWRGKLEVVPKIPLRSREDLAAAYTPGVALPCLAIQKDLEESYALTGRGNTVAVITDGTAVLGLGGIGPEAGMPVMEGKCVLFKALGGVDAIPLCIRSTDADTIVSTVALLAGSFGGINLEDISAPRCFEIEARLKALCDIPVFHDDQHGTAVVVLAALLNALKRTGRRMEELRLVVCGAGAAGTAIVKLLLSCGLRHVTVCGRAGALYPGMPGLHPAHQELARLTNPEGRQGSLAQVVRGADAVIGVSGPGAFTQDMVASMAKQPIVFALANPQPEILPQLALDAGAAIVGTGRSDYPNQINNVLAFPGIFRGALDVRAREIDDGMKLAAAEALAALAADGPELLPEALDPRVCPAVAAAVAKAAQESGAARLCAQNDANLSP